jgi:hypothetical protein
VDVSGMEIWKLEFRGPGGGDGVVGGGVWVSGICCTITLEMKAKLSTRVEAIRGVSVVGHSVKGSTLPSAGYFGDYIITRMKFKYSGSRNLKVGPLFQNVSLKTPLLQLPLLSLSRLLSRNLHA